MRVLIALALFAAVPAAAQTVGPAPGATNVKAGVEKWRAGDSAGAVAIWQPFAAAGDADAMFNMAQAYKLGRGVAKDPAQAREWYRRAAIKGHLPAQANLGILLFQAGEKPESMHWLKAAADKGEVRAQYVFGIATFNGDGTPRNLGLAYGYLLRASAQGLSQATSALGNIEATLSPVDRANGEAVSASLAAGQGVPAGLAVRPPLMAAMRNEVLKTAPPAAAPVVVIQPVIAPPKPQAAVVVAPKPQASVQPPPQPQLQPSQAAVKLLTTAAVTAKAVTTPPPQASDQAAVKTAPAKQSASDAADANPTAVPAKSVAAPVKQPVAMAAVPPVATPPKPAPLQVATQTAPATSSAPVKTAAAPLAKPAPAAIKPAPAGWRVQLGAFSKRSLADEAWAAIKREQKDAIGTAKPLFDDSGPVVKLQLGPFATKVAARDACAKLAFAGRACFVTGG